MYIELNLINSQQIQRHASSFLSDKCKFLSPSSFCQASELSSEKSVFDPRVSVSSSSVPRLPSPSACRFFVARWVHTGRGTEFQFFHLVPPLNFESPGGVHAPLIMGIMNRCDESKKLEPPAKEFATKVSLKNPY